MQPRSVRRAKAAQVKRRAERSYVLRIVPERAPEVLRTVELRGDQTLSELHHLIQDVFQLDDDHLYSFFLSGIRWDRTSEYARLPGPGERSAARAYLAELGLEPGKTFGYLFDYGDELWHEVTVLEVRDAEPHVSYPRLLEAVGAAPPQYPGAELPPLDDDIVELGDQLCEFLERPSEERSREQAFEELGLVKALCRALAGRGLQIETFEQEFVCDLGAWLLDLADELARYGAQAEALALLDEGLALGRKPGQLMGRRALLLARAGQAEEARAALAELRARFDDEDAGALGDEIDALRALGDPREAEARCRQVLADRDGDGDRLVHEVAAVKLVELLEAEERYAEAVRVRRILRRIRSELDSGY